MVGEDGVEFVECQSEPRIAVVDVLDAFGKEVVDVSEAIAILRIVLADESEADAGFNTNAFEWEGSGLVLFELFGGLGRSLGRSLGRCFGLGFGFGGHKRVEPCGGFLDFFIVF